MIDRFILIAIASTLVVTAQAGGIHKWVDENGRVHYGDHPPEQTRTEEIGPAVSVVSEPRPAPTDDELENAVDKRDAKRVKLLLSEGAAVPAGILGRAAKTNDVGILEELLNAREQSIAAIARTPGTAEHSMQIFYDRTIGTAVAYDAHEVVRFLAGRGANVEGSGLEPFIIEVVRRGYVQTARALLDNGADVNARKGWALRLAAESGDAAMVQVLLRAGADINAHAAGKFPSGPPLADATRRGHTDVVDMLRAYGAEE
ncbi:MAG: DUF4124 domain-containing protein [Gammaproteobacteria bacterium]|nr:DUF4124 domain-containing protein [Gammaproteobacteria bacterium]